MLIAIIRAHFSAQHAASEDKDQTHTKWGRERKKEKKERESGRERHANAWKRTFYCFAFLCEWDLEKRHKSLKMKNPLKMPRKYL